MLEATKKAFIASLSGVLHQVSEALDRLDEAPALAAILEPHIEAQFDGCPCGMSKQEHIAILRATLLNYAAMTVLTAEFEDAALMHGSRTFLTSAEAVRADIFHATLSLEKRFGESSKKIAEEALAEAIRKE